MSIAKVLRIKDKENILKVPERNDAFSVENQCFEWMPEENSITFSLLKEKNCKHRIL